MGEIIFNCSHYNETTDNVRITSVLHVRVLPDMSSFSGSRIVLRYTTKSNIVVHYLNNWCNGKSTVLPVCFVYSTSL